MNTRSNARILIVEDELPMRTALHDCLVGQNYRVLLATDGEAGLAKALEEQPDLLLLDVMMPRLDGFALCSELRRLGRSIPVLMLTAKGRVEDRVRGLDCGADDFLSKPFARDELLARVRALLRRAESAATPLSSLVLGEVRIDFVQQRAWRHDVPLHLTTKEFAMLRLLASPAGTPVSRQKFLDVVWGYTVFPTTRTVDKHIVGLRTKIEVNPEQPHFIETVHGIGYRLAVRGEATADKVTKA